MVDPTNDQTADDIDQSLREGKPIKLGWRQNLALQWEKNGIAFVIGGFTTLALLLFMWNRMVYQIYEGEAGVLYQRLFSVSPYKFNGGTNLEYVYDEGLQVILPWDKLTIYNIRLQQVDNTFDVLSNNGLTVKVTMSIRYRPVRTNLPELHQEVGPDYFNIIVLPEVQAIVREVFGRYSPEQIYTSDEFIIQNTVQAALSEVGERFVELDDLLITKIELPQIVRRAIEEKLKQQQIAEEFEFRVKREEKEAKRKRIEAEGIRDFQQIINAGITENYLRFKGIEATLELSKSKNAKVIIVGSGKDGMPLILNTGESEKEEPLSPEEATKESVEAGHELRDISSKSEASLNR